MALRSSWRSTWRRFWFELATLALRLRFSTGKASFVEADIEMTTNQVAEILDAPGGKPERRLMAHYQLRTHKPRAGRQGWQLFRERFGAAGTNQLVVLTCGFCGHHYVVQVLAAIDPLAMEGSGAKPPGTPASYGCDWFRFMHSDYEGTPSLYCVHCEQNGVPGVKFLASRRQPQA
jgi:hypothetical protein